VANDIGASITNYLVGQTTVTAIAADRGHPGHLPQGCLYPAFTVRVISDIPSHHMAGTSGLRLARLQIDSYDDGCEISGRKHVGTRRVANQLDEAILALLDMQRSTFGGTFCNTIQAEDRDEDEDLPVVGSDHYRYWTSRDYLVWYIP
jgi:hypothetical protein